MKCGCSNATILFVKPEPDAGSRERLSNLRTTYGLTSTPELKAAFYFDFYYRSLLAIRYNNIRNCNHIQMHYPMHHLTELKSII